MGKKKKVVYVDDGRTVADMSAIDAPRLRRPKNAPRSSGKDKWNTYWGAVRMMLGPTLVAITALGVLYLVMYFLFWLML